MLIQFKRPQCIKHRAAFQYICRTSNCSCPIRLCHKCIAQHQKNIPMTQYIKEENHMKKIQIESQIISKQYQFLQKMPLNEQQQMKKTKNNENIKVVQMIMKKAGQQKNLLFKMLQELDFNHKDTKLKLNRLKADYNMVYLAQMKNLNLLQTAISLYSPQGLHQLRIKYNRSNSIIKSFQQFIDATKSYGNTFNTFLKFMIGQQKLFLSFLQNVVANKPKSESKSRIFFENQEGKRLKFRQKGDQKQKKSRQHNKSEQILEVIPSSARKISLVTPKKRSCSSDKQN